MSKILIKWPVTMFNFARFINKKIRLNLELLRANSDVGLHLGCGANILANMINCDLIHPLADRYIDASNLSEYSDESVDLIESHHMIEHLSFKEADLAFREWSRVLKKGGRLVITCPNLTRVCLHWVYYSLLDRVTPQKEKLEYILRMISGPQNYEGMIHKSHYDIRRFSRLLPLYGFEVEFSCAKYPLRATPSLLVVAVKK